MAVDTGTSGQIASRPLCLTQLTPDAKYETDLSNHAAAPGLSRGVQNLKSGAVTLNGTYLMQHGITLPWSFPETMWVIEGTRL